LPFRTNWSLAHVPGLEPEIKPDSAILAKESEPGEALEQSPLLEAM
jgi:hypothetical protein